LNGRVVIPSDLEEARSLEEKLLDAVADQGFSEADQFAIRLALEEGLMNAIRHGNRFASDKQVHVTWQIERSEAVFTIADEGPGFHECTVPDPTIDENLERPCGRGLMLMRSFMDEVSYNEKGNEVRLVKKAS
jgi:serine/threonine-protein kinase RsbW